MIDMPKVTAAHEKLKTLVGKWRGEEKIHPSPFDPKGGDAVGLVTNRLALDGFAVAHDYEQQRGGKTNFRGLGIFRWDGEQNVYVLHWLDSFGGPLSEMRGSFEGKVLQLVGAAPGGQSRATFDFGGDRRYAYRMEISPDGKQWSTFMEGTYTRSD
jgi:uncharacterized protein DUF1579